LFGATRALDAQRLRARHLEGGELSYAEAASVALNAGCDLVLLCNQSVGEGKAVDELIDGLDAALSQGRWQPSVDATTAGIVYCTEPLFATLFALFLPAILARFHGITYANEIATTHLLIGGSLAVGANTTLTGITVAPDALNGWAVGHDALILATSDAGLTWRKSWQGDDPTSSFLDVLALDDRHVIAIGANGLCLETRDAGATWQRRKLIDDDLHLNRLTRGPTGTLYIAGESGTLLRSVDSGATWQPIESPYDGSFYGILPLGPTSLVAHGLRGRIYHSSDDGRVWELVPLADRVLLAAAIKLKNNQLLFAGQARAFFTSRDGARSIAPLNVPFTSAVAALLELPDGRILALGEGGATVFDVPASPATP
jgi:photosystem II stability/assembly factor-like uncharacterized protein